MHKSLESRQKLEETQKRREKLLSSCMAMLATMLGVEITPERVVLYQRPLADLTDDQIKRGFARAAKEYKPFGGSFPAPAELREFALREDTHRGFINDAQEILARGEKPPDWEPVSVEEIKRRIAEVAASKTIQ